MRKDATDAPQSVAFDTLGLTQGLLDNIQQLGYTQTTIVQSAVIPAALQGRDLTVTSQTGSGKTAAFLLPILQMVHEKIAQGKRPPNSAPLALVLCPTRELAQQVLQDAVNLMRGIRGIRAAAIVGGSSYFKQKTAMKGAQLVIATPGRLLDWVTQGGIDLSLLHTLVLDEADRMLDMGFSDDIHAICEAAQDRAQTLMFSATFTARETRLAQALMKDDSEWIRLDSPQEKQSNITQHLHWADSNRHQHKLLMHWLQDESLDQAVVFASTQADSDAIADQLIDMGISASSLHGAMPQTVRNRRLDALRTGRTKILVATDVAARGIDVPTITHVFNYGLPMKPEDYVHRIGRTGRAGRTGTAVTFALHSDSHKIRQIERYLDHKIDVHTIAGLEPKPPVGGFKPGPSGKRRGSGFGNKHGGAGKFEGKFEGRRPSTGYAGPGNAGPHAKKSGPAAHHGPSRAKPRPAKSA